MTMSQSKYKDIHHRRNVHSRQGLVIFAGIRPLCVPRERNVKDLNLVNISQSMSVPVYFIKLTGVTRSSKHFCRKSNISFNEIWHHLP